MIADDLLLPAAELTRITSALANTTQTDPIATILAEAEQTVQSYTTQYEIGDDWYARLVRPIALHALYSNIEGGPTKAIQSAYDKAYAELRDIRDGKFPGLDPVEETETGADPRAGYVGGKPLIDFGP